MEGERGVSNPYIIDEPVVEEARFFGREDVLAWAREILGARGTKRTVVIQGSHRIGKSSLLRQLAKHLPQTVFVVDLAAIEEDGLSYLLWHVASSIASSLRDDMGIGFSQPEVNDFLGDPNHFHEVFLPRVYKALKRRRLVLALDEITALNGHEGSLRDGLYAYLSVLMDSDLNVSLVLALEEWPERPPALLGEAFRWKLGPLDDDSARELIVEPSRGSVEYEYHAVRRILELSSGHPYFIQLLCYVLFERCATEGRTSARDVDVLVDEGIELASPYMEKIWNDSSPRQRMVLAGFASLRGAHGILLEQDLHYVLRRRGAQLSPSEMSQTCQQLIDRDVLERLGAMSYRFQVELFRVWVRGRRKPESVFGVARTTQVASAASDWMGKFLWPLVGLVVASTLIFWCLASWQPLARKSEPSATPVETEQGPALSFVQVTPTRDMSSTPVRIPTSLPPALDITYMLWDEGAGNWEICARSRDGSVVTKLTDNDVDDTSPVWSYDHRWLVFVSERDGNQEIYRMNADGSQMLNLTNNPAPDWTPSVSPDGTKVVFSSLRDDNWELYLMDADGSQPARMTFNREPDYAPAWSPDGSRIAFVSERDGNLEIYVMEADGSGEVRLTYDDGLDLSPAWSPDSSQIAFESYRDGNMEIYMMNADGSEQRNLTSYPLADDHGPSWTEDGLGLVFYSNRDGNWDLYLMSPQGGEGNRLTNTSALEQEPFWSS